MIEDKIREIVEGDGDNEEKKKELIELFDGEVKEFKSQLFWLRDIIGRIDDEIQEAKKWTK
jgi:hypothetical protein